MRLYMRGTSKCLRRDGTSEITLDYQPTGVEVTGSAISDFFVIALLVNYTFVSLETRVRMAIAGFA